jgi:hypothetical protein
VFFSFLIGCGKQQLPVTSSPLADVGMGCLEEKLRFEAEPLKGKTDFFQRLKSDFEECLVNENVGRLYIENLSRENQVVFEKWNNERD